MRIYGISLLNMRIFAFCKCACMERRMRIYGSSLPYMHILDSVNAHIWPRENAHIRKRASIYESEHAHIRKSAYMEAKNAHIQKLSSIYAHVNFCICTYTEAKMCIYGSSLPYMHILDSVNPHIRKAVHIRKRASIYAHSSLRRQ